MDFRTRRMVQFGRWIGLALVVALVAAMTGDTRGQPPKDRDQPPKGQRTVKPGAHRSTPPRRLGVTARPLGCHCEVSVASDELAVGIQAASLARGVCDGVRLNASHWPLRCTLLTSSIAWAPRDGPMHAGPFHAVFDQVPARPFDHATGDRMALGQVLVVAHALAILVQVAANKYQPLLLGGTQLSLLSRTRADREPPLDLALQYLGHAMALHERHHLRAAAHPYAGIVSPPATTGASHAKGPGSPSRSSPASIRGTLAIKPLGHRMRWTAGCATIRVAQQLDCPSSQS